MARGGGGEFNPAISRQGNADLVAWFHPEVIKDRLPQCHLALRRDGQFDGHEGSSKASRPLQWRD
jgi:hypothetical protein